MAYEKSAINTVAGKSISNHYGPREIGGETGQYPTSGIVREATVDFGMTGPLFDELWIPAGSQVVDIVKVGTLTSCTLKTVDASGADVVADVLAATAADAISGKLVAGGQAAGKGQVVVRYAHVA